MNALEHYVKLRNHLSGAKVGIPFPVTLDELSSVLCCTRRNVNFVLKSLESMEWIEWKPGRGRGHSSAVLFKTEIAGLVEDAAHRCMSAGDVKGALSLLERLGEQSPVRESFVERLLRDFGFHSETRQRRRRDVLRIPFYRPVPRLDPIFVHRRTESHFVRQIFDPLLNYNPAAKRVEPHLAHHVQSNEDATEWRLFLRKGIRFHHGRLCTAEDAAFTLRRIADPAVGSPHAWMAEGIKDIHIASDTCLDLTLHEPNRLLPLMLTSHRLSILPADLCGEPDFIRLPVGTGPFKLVRNDESIIEFEAFEHYFAGRAHLDAVEIWIMPAVNPPESQEASLDGMAYIPFRRSHSNAVGYTLQEKMETGSIYLAFNRQKEGPQQSRAFRKAIHHALDRDRFVRELGGFRHMPSASFIPELSRKIYENETDLDKARKWLQRSGYNGDTLSLYTYEMPSNEDNASWIAQECAKMGVNVKVTVLPIDELMHRMTEADMVVSGLVIGEPLELDLVELYSSSWSPLTKFMEDDLREEARRIIAESAALEDEDKSAKRLRRFEERLREEYAVLFLAHVKQQSSYHESLRGVSLNTLGWIDYKDLWVEPEIYPHKVT